MFCSDVLFSPDKTIVYSPTSVFHVHIYKLFERQVFDTDNKALVPTSALIFKSYNGQSKCMVKIQQSLCHWLSMTRRNDWGTFYIYVPTKLFHFVAASGFPLLFEQNNPFNLDQLLLLGFLVPLISCHSLMWVMSFLNNPILTGLLVSSKLMFSWHTNENTIIFFTWQIFLTLPLIFIFLLFLSRFMIKYLSNIIHWILISYSSLFLLAPLIPGRSFMWVMSFLEDPALTGLLVSSKLMFSWHTNDNTMIFFTWQIFLTLPLIFTFLLFLPRFMIKFCCINN